MDLDRWSPAATEAQRVLGRPLGSHVLPAGPVDWQAAADRQSWPRRRGARRRSTRGSARPGERARPSGRRAAAPARRAGGAHRGVRLPGDLRLRPGRALRGRRARGADRPALAGGGHARFLRARVLGRAQWLRSVLPSSEGVNVVGRLPSRGPRKRTLVLVAHHDAARTGLMWDPRLLAAGRPAADRTGKRASLALCRRPPSSGRRSAAARSRPGGPGAGWPRSRSALDQARSATVPGANDNASGVAGVLGGRRAARARAARRARGDRPVLRVRGVRHGRDGRLAALGGRAAGLGDSTLVLGLDTVGSGEPVVLEAEGGLWPVRYREPTSRSPSARRPAPGWAAALAAGGAGPTRSWRGSAACRRVSILTVREGGFPTITCRATRRQGGLRAASRRV